MEMRTIAYQTLDSPCFLYLVLVTVGECIEVAGRSTGTLFHAWGCCLLVGFGYWLTLVLACVLVGRLLLLAVVVGALVVRCGFGSLCVLVVASFSSC